MGSFRISWQLLAVGVLQLLQMSRTHCILIRPSHLIIIINSVLLVATNNNIEKIEKTITSPRCTYNFVINEIDSSVKCPKMYDNHKTHLIADDMSGHYYNYRLRHRHKNREQQDQPSRFMHQTYLRTLEDLVNRSVQRWAI